MSLPAIRTTPEQPHWYPVNHEQRFGLYGVSASLTTIAAIAILTLAPSVELMVSSARAPKTLVGNIIVALTLRLDIKSTVLLLLSLFVCTFLLERGAPRCCRKSFTW